MVKEYEKIKNYLQNYITTSDNYEQLLLDLHGISPFYLEVIDLLKKNKIENEYVFFGKILVTITKFNQLKIGDIVDIKNYFLAIKTQEDLDYFKNNILINSPNENILENILRQSNAKFLTFFPDTTPIFEKKHFELIFNNYDPEECLSIILILENLIKPLFSSRDRSSEVFKKIKNVADLLNEVTGITHNKKNDLKNKSKGSSKCTTNLNFLGLKS